MMKSRQRDDDDTDQAAIVVIEATRQRQRTCRLGIICTVVFLSMWPLWLMTREVAGQSTEVNVNVAIAYSIVTTLTTGGTTVGMMHNKKRADRAEQRERRLEYEVQQLNIKNERLRPKSRGKG